MLPQHRIFVGDVILPDRVLTGGVVAVRNDVIESVGTAAEILPLAKAWTTRVNVLRGYISPGFVDLHVHGGAGADFMDATAEAFETVLACHARHGTTSLTPTTTVATQDQLQCMLHFCLRARDQRPKHGARVLGAHFYGPYFNYDARGCHPGAAVRPPDPREYDRYLNFADAPVTATVAPELPGAEAFARACVARGIRVNVGHSNATFPQMAEAVAWGARHVDHLYCAMSDKSKLRQQQAYPMRGGVLEATLYFDELTTEVIADGRHLSPDLLQLALKLKGPDRLALVTDCSRALDMPEGEYVFGPLLGGEPFIHRGGVGLMPDGQALASSAQGMDHMVRTFAEQTGRPVWEVVRMASLTPAQIVGRDREIGSLEAGKRADLLILDPELHIRQVYIDGEEVHSV